MRNVLSATIDLVLSVSFVAISFSGVVIPTRALATSPKVIENSVRFVEPANEATVGPKFKVKMAVTGFKIDPAGTVVKGKGHHHLIVDGGPIPKGQVVPANATHIHFGKGESETELELAPGKHKLTLQFADGAHVSFGPEMSSSIDITVAAPAAK